jgi:hypothetical protein
MGCVFFNENILLYLSAFRIENPTRQDYDHLYKVYEATSDAIKTEVDRTTKEPEFHSARSSVNTTPAAESKPEDKPETRFGGSKGLIEAIENRLKDSNLKPAQREEYEKWLANVKRDDYEVTVPKEEPKVDPKPAGILAKLRETIASFSRKKKEDEKAEAEAAPPEATKEDIIVTTEDIVKQIEVTEKKEGHEDVEARLKVGLPLGKPILDANEAKLKDERRSISEFKYGRAMNIDYYHHDVDYLEMLKMTRPKYYSYEMLKPNYMYVKPTENLQWIDPLLSAHL